VGGFAESVGAFARTAEGFAALVGAPWLRLASAHRFRARLAARRRQTMADGLGCTDAKLSR
jgi:hypothetical protein